VPTRNQEKCILGCIEGLTQLRQRRSMRETGASASRPTGILKRLNAHQQIAKRFAISKSWTREDTGAGGYYTTVIRLGCSNSFGYVVAYRIEWPSESGGTSRHRWHRSEAPRVQASSDSAVWYATVDSGTMQPTATERKLGILEARGATDSRAFDLSTDGLSESLGRLQRHCDERREIRSP
jgi:hypothetical protein